MNCQEVSNILSECSAAAVPAGQRESVDAHLSECPACSGLVQSIDGIQHMPVPQSLFAPQEVPPVRPMTSSVMFIGITFVLSFLVAAIVAIWKKPDGWRALPDSSAVLFVMLASVGLGALVLGFYRQFKPGARDTLDGRAAVAIFAAGFVAYAAVEVGWRPVEDLGISWAWRCLTTGTLVAVATALALFSWARQGFAANPKSAGFWTGALASMSGIIALTVHCPALELSHWLIWHGSVIVIASGLSAWIGRRFFSLK